jgi:serine/threonine protein kinase
MTGTKAGTPVFIPRQQLLNFKYVQQDVDIWATAACLYNMLTGTYPRNVSGNDPFLYSDFCSKHLSCHELSK